MRLAKNRSGVLARSANVLVVRVLGAGVAFVVNVVIARRFGAGWAGTYFLATALIMIAVTVAKLGTELPMMKQVAVAASRSDWPQARGALRTTFLLAGIAAAMLAAIVAAGSGILGDLLGEPRLGEVLPIMAASVVAMSLTLLLARALAGVDRPAIGEFIQRAGFHLAFLAILFLPVGLGTGALLGAAHLASYLACLGLGLLVWRWAVDPGIPSRVHYRSILRPAFPLLVAASIQLVINLTDTLVLGYFRDSVEVGVYGNALRVTTLLAYTVTSVAAVVAPRLGQLHASRDRDRIQAAARSATGTALLLALPLFVVFVAFSEQVMGLFGEEFVVGSTALVILAIGQLANAATGVSADLLAMTDEEFSVFGTTAVAAAVNVTLNLMLVPRFGIEGAAVASAVSLVVLNLGQVILIRRRLGFWIVGRRGD